jgi:membrane protein required for colicin V production
MYLPSNKNSIFGVYMNYLDIVLSVPLLWGLYKGITRGIIKELSTLLALVLGIYGAVNYSDIMVPIVSGYITIDANYQSMVCFSITFILIVLIVRLIGALLDKVVSLVSLTFISRLMGGFFGLFRMAFVCSALLLVLNTINKQFEMIPNQDIADSILYETVSDLVPLMSSNSEHAEGLLQNAEKAIKNAEDSVIP